MINYEIIFAYLDDAKKAYREEKWKEFKVALRKAQNSIGELMQTLDFSYDISRNLYRIYVFCKDSLACFQENSPCVKVLKLQDFCGA